MRDDKEGGFWGKKKTQVPILAFPLAGWGTQGKWRHISASPCPHLWNGHSRRLQLLTVQCAPVNVNYYEFVCGCR